MIDRARLRELASAATPGRWHWWTSNSWRRLTTEIDGRAQRDGGVLCPCVSRGDGHPDLIIKVEDAAYIAAAHPGVVIELLDEMEKLELEISLCEAGEREDG